MFTLLMSRSVRMSAVPAFMVFTLLTSSLNAKRGFVKTHDGAKIFYDLDGKKKKPTILFLHDIPGNHTVWKCQVNCLKKHYQTLSIDLRGFGRSTAKKGFDLKHFVSDINCVLRALEDEGVSKPTIVANGFSSLIAFAYALKYTDGDFAPSKLVIVDGSARFADASIGQNYAGFTQAQITDLLQLILTNYATSPNSFVDYLIQHIVTGKCGESPATVKLTADLRTIYAAQDPKVVHAALSDLFEVDLRSQLTAITIPTLIVYGGNDQFLPVASNQLLSQFFYLRSALNPNGNALLFELCNKGHAPFLTDVERFNTEVSDFICDRLCDCVTCDLGPCLRDGGLLMAAEPLEVIEAK